jgi:hypothetical protein
MPAAMLVSNSRLCRRYRNNRLTSNHCSHLGRNSRRWRICHISECLNERSHIPKV